MPSPGHSKPVGPSGHSKKPSLSIGKHSAAVAPLTPAPHADQARRGSQVSTLGPEEIKILAGIIEKEEASAKSPPSPPSAQTDRTVTLPNTPDKTDKTPVLKPVVTPVVPAAFIDSPPLSQTPTKPEDKPKAETKAETKDKKTPEAKPEASAAHKRGGSKLYKPASVTSASASVPSGPACKPLSVSKLFKRVWNGLTGVFDLFGGPYGIFAGFIGSLLLLELVWPGDPAVRAFDTPRVVSRTLAATLAIAGIMYHCCCHCTSARYINSVLESDAETITILPPLDIPTAGPSVAVASE